MRLRSPLGRLAVVMCVSACDERLLRGHGYIVTRNAIHHAPELHILRSARRRALLAPVTSSSAHLPLTGDTTPLFERCGRRPFPTTGKRCARSQGLVLVGVSRG